MSVARGGSGGGDRRFGLLLSATAIANLADGVGKVALPLLATTQTRDPALIAGLSVAQFLPWLVCALPAGVLLDRVDRRLAAIVANAARAVLIGGLAVLALADAATLWHVYLTAVLVGAAETVADTASNALVPSVVPTARLEHANSRLQSAETIGQHFLGNPVGSLTFAVFAAFPFLLNSIGFAVAAALLFAVAGTYRPAPGPPAARPVLTDLRDGWRWILRTPLLLRLMLLMAAVNVAFEIAMAQLVLYALGHLRISESAFGVFAAVNGLGGLLGAALAPRVIARWRRRAVLTGGLLVAGVSVAAMGLTTDPVLAAVLYGAFGVPVMAVNVVSATVRHSAVPRDYLGRVLGTWRTVVLGAVPVGALAGGLLAKALPSGTAAVFVVSGALQVVLAGVAYAALRRFGPELTRHTGEGPS